MKFTTPCFVCVKDVDKRNELTEWLEGIGYHVCSCCLFDGWNTLHCCLIHRVVGGWQSEVHGVCDYDEETRYSIDLLFKAENADSKYPSIDCGENVELFKALAAMNDENDREQWFTNGEDWALSMYNDFDGCMTTAAECEAGNVGCYTYCEECGFRKATAEEIVEYFKTKKK